MLALLLQTIEQYLQHLNQATVKLPDQKAVPWDKKKKKKNKKKKKKKPMK